MASLTRLVTLVDIRDDAGAGSISVSAYHEAVLADGRRAMLLDDRGWSASRSRGWAKDVPEDDSIREDVTAHWAGMSVEDIEKTTRDVVGPDEFGGRSQEHRGAEHWASRSETLQRQDVVADARDLKRRPHGVVLSERLLACTGRHDAASP